MFVDRAHEAQEYIENPQHFLLEIRKNTTSSGALSSLREIKNLLDLKQNANFEACVQVAKDMYLFNYDHNIRDLLALFPKDHLDT